MNVADIGVMLVLAALVVLGVRRGLLGQVLLLAATLLSALVAAVVAYLVASDVPQDGWARLAAPIAFFVALALSSWLLRFVARGISGAVHRLPFGSLDRVLGAFVALIVGSVMLSVLVLGLVTIPDNPVRRTVESARTTPWLLEAGAYTSAFGARYAAVLDPLARRFEEARGLYDPVL